MEAIKTSSYYDGDIIKDSETLVFNPYNPNNKEITLNEVQSILQFYGINAKVFNLKLYQRAFVHRSYTKRPDIENSNTNVIIVDKPSNCLPLKTKSNERLEFIGDGVLELVIKYYLYKRFPKADEGFMTEKKIALVKNEHIGKLAYEMKLHNMLIISKHAEEKNIRTNLKKLGCLFEAFIGALFLDFNKININDEHNWFENVFCCGPGFQMAQIFIENIFEKHVDWTKLIKTDDNYKNILQVVIQKELKITPDYLEINLDSDIGYTMGVFICIGKPIHHYNINDAIDYNTFGTLKSIKNFANSNDNLFIYLSRGTHKIKKKAEQIACEKALAIINSIED